MDAHFYRAVVLTAALSSMGASQRSANFVVTAPTPQMAAQISQAAENFRRELAVQWLGSPMPAWSQPCPIEVQVAPHLGAGGATSFLFEHGEVYGWQMTIQGSMERVLDSVLPHEITHTVFATHFRRPLPRWADEGACTTVEHSSERMKQQVMLVDFLRTGRGIPFSRMFVMKEYPHDVMPLYSQGYSLARYLISHGGRRKFLDFVADGMQDDNWARAMNRHYGYANLGVLQTSWLDWVRQGSPALESSPQPGPAAAPVLASNERRPRPEANLIYRGQDGPNAGPTPGPVDDSPSAGREGRVTNLVGNGGYDSPQTDRTATEPKSAWHVPRRESYVSDMTQAPAGEGKPAESDAVASDGQSQPGRSEAATGAAPAAARPAEKAGHQVTRPQPIEQSRQIILEWSRK